jgi:hypothetical protein
MTTQESIQITNRQKILFYLLTSVSWYACVSSANTSIEGFCISLIFVNYWSFRKLFPQMTWRNIWPVVPIGIFFDQIMITLDVIRLPSLPVVPIWLISLWCIFSLSLPLYQEIALLKDRKKAAVLGAVGGILTYYAGEKFEVLYYTHWYSYVLYGIFWGLLFSRLDLLVRRQAR